MLTMYGIKNCDTIKKARRWLDEHNLSYRFHDYRVDGINLELLNQFSQLTDYKNLINSKGTTWRSLDEHEKNLALADKEHATKLMLNHPALIKRPLLFMNNQLLLGFSVDSYAQFIKQLNL